jgi:hypothetical protein
MQFLFTIRNALINGPIPEAMILNSMNDLADEKKFRGANIVFIAPDENVESLKTIFHQKGINNDLFGVREAKGLEFDAVVLLGFFSYVEQRKSNAPQWRNVLLWLFSSKGITTTESSEIIHVAGQGRGQKLESCDYLLSHPEIEDQAMMLYTALTRARNHLYLIEFENDGIMRKKGEKGLAAFAFRCLKHPQLSLIKTVHKIDEGRVEMTSQEHKARGVLMVTQAIDFSRGSESLSEIREKFEEAGKRFLPAYGDDKELYEQVSKHLEAVILKVELVDTMKTKFFDRQSGAYNLECQFAGVLKFEENLVKFFGLVVWDTFLMDEFHKILGLVEEMFQGTPYEIRFGEPCFEMRQRHESWLRVAAN